jgi:hypothetical protein
MRSLSQEAVERALGIADDFFSGIPHEQVAAKWKLDPDQTVVDALQQSVHKALVLVQIEKGLYDASTTTTSEDPSWADERATRGHGQAAWKSTAGNPARNRPSRPLVCGGEVWEDHTGSLCT